MAMRLEKVPSHSSRLYYTYTKPVQHVAYKVTFQNVNACQTRHDCLGHPMIGMMRKVTNNFVGHTLSDAKFAQSSNFVCTACATGKLILRPSYLKIHAEPLKFLERIQGDMWSHSTIVWAVQVFYGSHRRIYKMVSCESPSTRNHVFAKIVA